MLNPSLSLWVHCTDAFIFPVVGSTGALCWLGLHWAHCTGECNLPHVGLTGEYNLLLSWSFRPDFFGVLYLFIPWTYKPDNDHLNTYISPSVVCVINRQNIILKYGMRDHFRYNLPFLVIDDDTTKTSKMNCKDMKLIPIWKVRNYLACSDDISMLILKATGIWNWYQL